jgi:hypothetical protein
MNTPIPWCGSGRSGIFRFAAALALFIVAGSATVSMAADKLGEASAIHNTVTGSQDKSAARRLAVADPVFDAETIAAGADSHGELRLNDDSLVIVGENSAISLDDFVVSDKGFSAATLKVTKGAFRFITGDSPKKAFNIQTPLSAIGVRGTIFDVYVDEPTGNTKVVLFRGALRVCTSAQACMNVSRSCDIIEVRSPSDIERLPFLRSRQRSRTQEAAQFRLSENQSRFQRQWRVPTVACSARAAQEATRGGTTNSNGDFAPDNTGGPGIGEDSGRDRSGKQ